MSTRKHQEHYGKFSFKELVRILVSHTPIAYVLLDKQFRIHFINEYFMKLRQLDEKSTIGEFCYNLSNRGRRCAICAVAKTMKTGQKDRVMRKDIFPNGEIRYIDDISIPIVKNSQGDFDYILEIMINRTNEMLHLERMENDFAELVRSLSTMLEAKDKYTATHSGSVRKISVIIAKAMGLSKQEIRNIHLAASLHDIGKVAIPYAIINKEGKLNDEEFQTITSHPQTSYDILTNISGFETVKQYVKYHHEKWNGKGYPDGLQGEEIPLGARIIAVADAYDAMTSTRSYRKALSHDFAMSEIAKYSGIQFDPMVAAVFQTIDLKASLHADELLFVEENQPKQTQVERNIASAQTQNANPMEDKRATKDFLALHNSMNEDLVMEAIFLNAPASYCMMDNRHNIVFVSESFIELMELDREVLFQQKCYEASGYETMCKNCPMADALSGKKLTITEMTKQINGKTKYLECYALPYIEPKTQEAYIIEIMIDRTEEKKLQLQNEQNFYNLIQMLTDLLALNDEKAFQKSQYIREICSLLANKMELSAQQKNDITLAATVCDIGMIAIGEKDRGDKELTKKHPELACEMIERLSGFDNAVSMVRHHHELCNGKGYPNGLTKDEIPLGAKMIGLAGAYYNYLYLGHDAALSMLKENKEGRYDDALIAILIDICNKNGAIQIPVQHMTV